jgi:hypothetical protein
MRIFKLLGVPAVAAVMLIGASSAMGESTVACEVATSPCPVGKEITNAIVTGLTTSAFFLNSIDPIRCTHSIISFEVLTLASPLVAHLTLLDFTGCRGQTSGFKCESSVPAGFLGLFLLSRAGGDFAFGKIDNTRVRIKCAGGLSDCTYAIVGSTWTAVGGAPAALTAAETVLEVFSEGGFAECPSTASFDTVYTVTGPAAVHFST